MDGVKRNGQYTLNTRSHMHWYKFVLTMQQFTVTVRSVCWECNEHHGLYAVETVVQANRVVNGKGQIRPATSPKLLEWFWWNSNLELSPEVHPPCKIPFQFDVADGLGEYQFLNCISLSGFILCLSFSVGSSRAQFAPVDRCWQQIRHMTSLGPMVRLGARLGFKPSSQNI